MRMLGADLHFMMGLDDGTGGRWQINDLAETVVHNTAFHVRLPSQVVDNVLSA